MKVLIVFCAFLIVFSMALSYIQDMNACVQAQRLLQILAEDCAEAGALTIDDKTGEIKKDAAFAAASEILSSSGLFPSGSVSVEYFGVTRGGNGFEISLVYYADFFRLPFMDIKEIRRSSEYVWEQ